MLHHPTRRDLIKYGIGLSAYQKMRGQSMLAITASSGAVAAAGIALVNGNNTAGGISSATTSPVDARLANFAILTVSSQGGVVLTVSDNSSGTNSFTALTHTGGSPDCNLYYCKAFVGNAAHTFTCAGSGELAGIAALTFSGLTTSSPFDKESGAAASGVPGLKPGALTPTAANSLFVTSLSSVSTATADDLGAGFTQSGVRAVVGGTSYAVAIAYLIQVGGPASKDPQWNVSPNDTIGAKMAVLK